MGDVYFGTHLRQALLDVLQIGGDPFQLMQKLDVSDFFDIRRHSALLREGLSLPVCLLTRPATGGLLNQPWVTARPEERSSIPPGREFTAVGLPNLAKPLLENHAKAQAQQHGDQSFWAPEQAASYPEASV